MKKNNYQTPEVEVFEVRSQGAVCDFIPVSGPVDADVKEIGQDAEEEFNIWGE